ncbi:MAG: SAM-dependent methyltransferase [Acidobacteriota bacterium]
MIQTLLAKESPSPGKSPTLEPLAEILRDRIRSGGPIPFRDFMQEALYHHQHGYYAAGRVRIGREGDFFTSSHVHSAFGELIGRQIGEMAANLDLPAGEPFWILEAGPGQGHLAADLRRSAGGGGRQDYRLGLIEPSPALRRIQEKTLAAAGFQGDAVWWPSLAEATRERVRSGCLLANEVLDSLPVHRVVMREGKIREIFVDWEGDRFQEIDRQPTSGKLADYFAADGIDLLEGQEAEVNLAAGDWLRQSSRLFRSGYLLIIDYGRPARELYAPDRLRGTLLCYHRHRANEDYYRRVGLQDMTSHLNLSAVVRDGEAAGWRLCGITDQMRFLISLGILDRIESLAARTDPQGIRERLGLRQLIQPGGMGEIFQVLIFRRGQAPGDLLGVRDPFWTAGDEPGG